MKIKFLGILLPFLLFFVLSALANQKAPINVQLKWRHQFQFAGLYAAQIKGYYEQEGLEVVLKEGGSKIAPVNEVLAGRADIGIFDPNVVLRSTKEKPLVLLAAIMQSSPYGILSLKSKNILKPSDLIGKTVLAEQDQGWDIFKAVLLKEGIKPQLINIIPRTKDAEEITKNKADAVVTYITTQWSRLKSQGYDLNLLRPVAYGIDFYGDVIFTSKSYAYEDKERTNAFIRATLKGWEYALAHEEELITYILSLPETKERGLTRELLRSEAQEVKKLIMPELINVGNINVGRIKYMLNVYKELGIIKKDINLDGAIYEGHEDDHAKWIKPVIYTVTALVILIICIAILNWQLRKKVAEKTKDLRKEIERKREAENIASQNELRLQLTIKSANIGLWEWDLNTNAVSLSKEWCDLLKFPDGKLPHQFDLFKLLHPADLNNTKREFFRSLKEPKSKKVHQVRILNNDGSILHVLISFKILRNDEGDAQKLFGVIINVDEIEKKKAELLEISEELMQSNSELKKFAYITSHNLRGPVVNLMSLMQLIDKSDLTKENTLIVEKVEASVKRLNNTLGDLIDIVSHQKPENKRLTWLDLNKEIKDVILSIESQLVKSDALIDLDLSVKEMLYSKMFFESIMLNLLTNAVKYREESRRLTIKISTKEDDKYIILKVEDNGKGIDMEKNGQRIFGLYQRFHDQIEGKGIGLFIIKSHIESLQGSISIDSQLDRGTAFTIKFAKL